jgi:hypothetical protein
MKFGRIANVNVEFQSKPVISLLFFKLLPNKIEVVETNACFKKDNACHTNNLSIKYAISTLKPGTNLL